MRHPFNILILLLLSLVWNSCQKEQTSTAKTHSPLSESPLLEKKPAQLPSPLFPTQTWTKSTPEEMGVDPDGLDSALQYLASHCGENGLDETLVIRRGRIIWSGDSTFRIHPVWSCTKSFISCATGLLYEEGQLSIHRPVADYLPRLASQYPDITPRHIMTMTSGYQGSQTLYKSHDALIPGLPAFEPGEYYEYSNDAMSLLSLAMTQILQTSIENYLAEKIMYPIGMENWQWDYIDVLEDGTPIQNGATGLRMSAREHARFGLLYLNKGFWQGKSLIPASWIEASIHNQVPENLPVRGNKPGAGHYGYNWWVIPDGPVSAAFTSGYNHNVCLIIPAWEMVIVRQGTDGNPAAGKLSVYTELLRQLAPAITSNL